MPASAVGKEWRGHVEQTKKHEEAIRTALPLTSTQLALIGNEVSMYGILSHGVRGAIVRWERARSGVRGSGDGGGGERKGRRHGAGEDHGTP